MFSEQTNIGINGTVKIPGDKSISHRSIIVPSISKGISRVSNILESDDVLCTLNAFREMGVRIEKKNDNLVIFGNGLDSLKKPNNDLYLSENVWSTTTGRHLTWIDGGSKDAKKERIKYNDLLDIFKDKNINKHYN